MNTTLGLGIRLAGQPLPQLVNQQKSILAQLIQRFGYVLYEYLKNRDVSREFLDRDLKVFEPATLKTMRDQLPLFTLEELKALKSFEKTYTLVRRLEYPFVQDVQKEYRLQLRGKRHQSDVESDAKEDFKCKGVSLELVEKVEGLAERYLKVLLLEVKDPVNVQVEMHVLNKFRSKLAKALIEGDSSEGWLDNLFKFVKFIETPLGARYCALELAWLQNVREISKKL